MTLQLSGRQAQKRLSWLLSTPKKNTPKLMAWTRFGFIALSKTTETYGLGLLHAFGESDSSAETVEYSHTSKPFGFPVGLVSFAREGGGDLICFDYRNRHYDDDPAVLVWHQDGEPGTLEESSPVANSFDEFLDMLFKE